MGTQLVMYEEEFTKINAVCDRLTKDANAKVVFLVDKNGQLISCRGPDAEHRHHLAGLADGRQRRGDGRARQADRRERVPQPVPRGREGLALHDHRRAAAWCWSSSSTTAPSLGLVRLRIKKASDELTKIFEALVKKTRQPRGRLAVRRDLRRRHRQPLQRVTREAMSFINYSSREINCKIVYYGPGLCGKTTNLQYIYNKTNRRDEGQADLALHRDGPHALLRLPPAVAR